MVARTAAPCSPAFFRAAARTLPLLTLFGLAAFLAQAAGDEAVVIAAGVWDASSGQSRVKGTL